MSARRIVAVAVAVGLLGLAVGGGLVATVLLAPRVEPVRYTVVRGDTLSLIAAAHGVTVAELQAWNALDTDRIDVGQVLEIWPTAAEAPPPRAARAGRRPPPGGTADRPRLELPPEKPCLAGPTLDGAGDEAMAASEGLSHEQVSAAMNAFLPNVLPCLAAVDPAPTEALRLDLAVGCNGRVTDVRIDHAGDWTPETAACVTEVLRFAPFPAHGLPDGDTFVFPLRYTP